MEVSNDRLSRSVNPDDLEIGDVIAELDNSSPISQMDEVFGFLDGRPKKQRKLEGLVEVMGISFPYIAIRQATGLRGNRGGVIVIDSRGRDLVVMTPSLINAINGVN